MSLPFKSPETVTKHTLNVKMICGVCCKTLIRLMFLILVDKVCVLTIKAYAYLDFLLDYMLNKSSL